MSVIWRAVVAVQVLWDACNKGLGLATQGVTCRV